MTPQKDFKFQVGCDFVDFSTGVRTTSISLLDEQGKSIWIADFENCRLIRLGAIKALIKLKEDLLEECKEILIKNKPKVYGRPKV